MLSKVCFADRCYVADPFEVIALTFLGMYGCIFLFERLLRPVFFYRGPCNLRFLLNINAKFILALAIKLFWFCARSGKGTLQFNATGKSKALSHCVTWGFAQALGTTSKETWADFGRTSIASDSQYRFQVDFRVTERTKFVFFLSQEVFISETAPCMNMVSFPKQSPSRLPGVMMSTIRTRRPRTTTANFGPGQYSNATLTIHILRCLTYACNPEHVLGQSPRALQNGRCPPKPLTAASEARAFAGSLGRRNRL